MKQPHHNSAGQTGDQGRQHHSRRKQRSWSKLLFPVVGLASLAWFLIRVIPKPSRASYPCMKVAAPLASSFVIWLSGLVASTLALARARQSWRRSRPWLAAVFAALACAGVLWTTTATYAPGRAHYADFLPEANQPMGTAQGLFPGRVVWVWNPDATNENADPASYGHSWFMPENNDQAVIDHMLAAGLKSLTGATTDAAGWDAVFKFHNQQRGKGEVGYQKGERIFIKTNATSSWSGNFSTRDLSAVNNNYYGTAETSPQLVLSLLRQLVHVAGVAQTDIYLGDPIKHIYKHAHDLWQPEFPEVHYMDFTYGAEKNRERFSFTNLPTIFYSDLGRDMPYAVNDRLCTLFESCEYVINVPALKGHKRAGITMFAKNHFGSQSRGDAFHMHEGLVNPTERDPYRQGYGRYRVQVDLMGHKWLGGKLLFCLMDALFAGPEAVYRPTKWQTPPFRNDWTSSIFLSQDPVAIESVGYDFLRAEYTGTTPYGWVQMEGVDDYLHQAADKANWPPGLTYDPERDGTEVGSLGVHEHWNSVEKKQYTRNLGTGNGIELVLVDKSSLAVHDRTAAMPATFRLHPNHPNPFRRGAAGGVAGNTGTTIRYELPEPCWVEMMVFNLVGQKVATLVAEQQTAGMHQVAWHGTHAGGAPAAAGLYVCLLRVHGSTGVQTASTRMVLLR